MSETYYCTKCNRNHRYSSQIGQKHLSYKENDSEEDNLVKIILEKDTPVKSTQPLVPDIIHEEKESIEENSSNLISQFIKGYYKSYRKGVERFGVWWKVFQLSIWSIILIFVLTACIIFIVFLPKIDMINWILR